MSSAITLSPTAPVPSAPRRGSYLAPDLVVRGRIQCSGVVEIDGAMQGDIQAETLVVGPQGRIAAAIDANMAVVGGKVDGVLKSRAVTFAQGCDFNGEVQYEALGVEPEARVQGVMVPVIGSNARHHVGQVILPVERPVSRMPDVTAKPAAQAAGQTKTGGERPSLRGRTILWLVTLMGVLMGAGLAAMVGGTPGVVQWWALVRSEAPAAVPAKTPAPVDAPPATPVPADEAGAPPAAPSDAPPVEAQATKAVPVAEKAPGPDKQISAKAQADAEIAEKAAAAARIKAEAEAKAKTEAMAEKAAAAKAKADAEAAAKADAAARADAEAKAKAEAASKAKADLDAAAAEKAKVESENTAAHKGASGPDSEAEKPKEPAKRNPVRKDGAALPEGGCAWVLQCEGPGNNKCVSVRQCSGD